MNKKLFSFLLITALLVFSHLLYAADRGLQRNNNASFAQNNNRFALIIGNSNYSQLPSLKNPRNDAEDINRSLSQLGFKTELLTDVDQETMESKIVDFGRKLGTGGVGLFYYAGHGIQSKGHNYLIPANANLKSEKDLRYKTVDVGQVLAEMENANNGFNIVILDACRNNPLASQFRSATRGLTRINAPRGTLVAFATGPGMSAEDGQGRNGTFTKHFLVALKIKNIPIEQTFKNVLKNVDFDTQGRQTPWVSSSFTGDFYFNLSSSTDLPITVSSSQTTQQETISEKTTQQTPQIVAMTTNPQTQAAAIKPSLLQAQTSQPSPQTKYGFDGRWEGFVNCGESPGGYPAWRRIIKIRLENHKLAEYTIDFSHVPRKKLNFLHHGFPEEYFISDTLMRAPARGEIDDDGEFQIKYDYIFKNEVYDAYLNGRYDGEKFLLIGRQAHRDCDMTLYRMP